MTPTLDLSVSLWGVSYVVLFRILFQTLGNKNRSSQLYFVCLDISAKFLIACNLLAPTDENGAVGYGFDISSIKYSSTLVDAS